MKIALQAGHQNIKQNSIVSLRGSTGAGDEANWTPKMRDAISAKLINAGFQVFLFDANANDSKDAKQDFDLFLALHWDADVYGRGGGFADWPDPSQDAVNDRSKEIATAINTTYFPQTSIELHPERSNPNTKFYYMWQSLTAKTPCVLLECGTNNKDNLPSRIDEVSTAAVKGILKAFGLKEEAVNPLEKEVIELKKQIDSLTLTVNGYKTQLDKVNAKLTQIKLILL